MPSARCATCSCVPVQRPVCAALVTQTPLLPAVRPCCSLQFSSQEERDEWCRKEAAQLRATVAQKEENQRGAQQQLAAAQAEEAQVGWLLGCLVHRVLLAATRIGRNHACRLPLLTCVLFVVLPVRNSALPRWPRKWRSCASH